ncbi:4-coumarate--CoA ligase 1 [Drosophila willistoni]|uniref:4-coumarate--CoA ligase 1 n=1 Tax=Drosophila willistoni TaxID=7260 RepID=UPI000C26D44B|nr:4-coumarate--CoA ligase 1 [Drosophila willistoni]
MYHENCSVGKIIHNALKNHSENVCQINAVDGKITTNREMLNWSVRIAQHLKKRNFGTDDVIGIVSRSSTYQSAVAVGCLFNATPFHSVNPTFNEDTIRHILSITKPKIIFFDGIDIEKIKNASMSWHPELITLSGKVNGAHVEDLLDPTNTEFFFEPQSLTLGESQTMAILCSSGTSGLPKAVCMANYFLMHLFAMPVYTSDMVIFSFSGLDWFSGLQQMLLSTAVGCTRIITDQSSTSEYLLELIGKYNINMIALGPSYVSELVACPLATPERFSTVRVLFISGGWIATDTLQKMQELAKLAFVIFGYGSTEIGAISGGYLNYGNSVGQLLPGRRGRIVSEEGENLGHNEVGEIYIQSGNSKWGGYYGNSLETQKTYDDLEWFHTGDIGYFDDHNNLHIVDRKKDICKCKGFQYWPNQIEAVVAQMPNIKEVCVVGIYDELLGDAPAAMIVKKEGHSLDEEQVKKQVGKLIDADYMHLYGGVYFVDEIPKNFNGKVLRREVKEQIKKLKKMIPVVN